MPRHTNITLCETVFGKQHNTVLEHPLYSPDLTPCDFYLFPLVKSTLKGTHFQSVEKVKAKMADLLKKVTPNDLQHCFEQWKTCMQQCIDREGEYVEED